MWVILVRRQNCCNMSGARQSAIQRYTLSIQVGLPTVLFNFDVLTPPARRIAQECPFSGPTPNSSGTDAAWLNRPMALRERWWRYIQIWTDYQGTLHACRPTAPHQPYIRPSLSFRTVSPELKMRSISLCALLVVAATKLALAAGEWLMNRMFE